VSLGVVVVVVLTTGSTAVHSDRLVHIGSPKSYARAAILSLIFPGKFMFRVH